MNDIILIKYNGNGDLLWNFHYNSPEDGGDHPVKMCVDHACNIYLIGYTSIEGKGLDYLTLKVNPDGVPLWINQYNSNENVNDIPKDIVIDTAGNVYITGESNINNKNCYPFNTIKYNPDGVIQWITQYPQQPNEWAKGTALDLDLDGNIYLTGTEWDSSGMNCLTIKYDSKGNMLWEQKAPFYWTEGTDVLCDNNNHIFISGDFESIENEKHTKGSFAIKYQENGSREWIAPIISQRNFVGHSQVGADTSGNIYVTARDFSDWIGSAFHIVKLNKNGESLWRLDRSGAYDAIIDLEGSIYVTGNNGDGLHSWPWIDMVTYKCNPLGEIEWQQQFDSTPDSLKEKKEGIIDKGDVIWVDELQNVYVAGNSAGYLTVFKYIQMTIDSTNGNTNDSTNVNPKSLPLLQNCPNPFKTSTKIQFSVHQDNKVRLKIYNLLGQLVDILINDVYYESGDYEINWQPHNLSSGVYIFLYVSAGHDEKRKCLYLK